MTESYNINGLSSMTSQHYPNPHVSAASSSIPRRAGEYPPESNTLPPINGRPMQQYPQVYSHGGSISGSLPQTPMTPHTPVSASSSAPPDPGVYTQANSNQQHNGGPLRTLQPPPNYGQNQAGAQTLPQLQQSYGGLPRLLQQSPSMPNPRDQDVPTHVVGQQGRRGILPSAPGRAAPSGKTQIPPKNEDGKFPCPHCTKTYLHAKHLKRHMLRHTGDRPYQCKLCKDTFSRSDILKRHFQKCSIRRGHTGDTNHLEGSRNHLKKNQPQNKAGPSPTGNPAPQHSGYMGGVPNSNSQYDPSLGSGNQFSMTPLQNFVAGQQGFENGMQSLSNRSSRSNSLMQPEYAAQTTMAGMAPSMTAFSMAAGQPNPYAFAPPVTTTDMAAQHARASNGMFKQDQDMSSWNGAYQSNGTEPSYPMFPSGPVGGADRAIKAEPDMIGGNSSNGHGDVFGHMYTSTSSHLPTNHVFDGWNLGDPFDDKAAALIAFCFADGMPSSPNELQAMEKLKEILTATNIKRYLQSFRTHFNKHWPVIHMPTFSTCNANNGLLLAMICVGAIYSDDMSLEMERWLMALTKNAVERSFRTLNWLNGQSSAEHSQSFQSSLSDVEEIQALVLLQAMFNWHGETSHREQAREDFKRLIAVSRQCGLLQPIPYGQTGYSILHQSHRQQASIDIRTWDWKAWVEQEQRSRAMYMVYLIDSARALYFNCPPGLASSEMQIQLPADDAAWEAPDANTCKTALGLNGEALQHRVNVSGSRRSSQPEFHLCMQLLFSPQSEFAPRTTNVYSKFILMHALHASIWTLQNQYSTAQFQGGLSSSTPGTPLSQYDWVQMNGNSMSNPSSGRATPTESQAQQMNQQHSQSLNYALEKWKRAWEADIDVQYPSGGSPGSLSVLRIGFCRDAVHYYWLAKQLLSNSKTFAVQMHADQRMCFVLAMLKQIRTFVAKEGYRLGKELGSMTQIDEKYAVDTLRMNMKMLFVALPENDSTPAQNSGAADTTGLLR